MSAGRVRGTARDRATVVTMILVATTLPVLAKMPVFDDVVWVFWLAALLLIGGALALVLHIIHRERRDSGS